MDEPHISTKRLIAYRQGTLPDAEREAVQEHLSLCPRCTGLLRELKTFEAESNGAVAEGPESQRQEAWESLVRRLPARAPAVARMEPRRSRAVLALAAALLLAVVGLALWSAATVQQERQRLALLEQQLKEREEALAAAQRALAETERQLAEARRNSGRVGELEARVAELTATLEELRREPRAPQRIASNVELSVSPRFVLRGQEAPELLRGGGAVNPVRQTDRVHLTFSLGDHPLFDEYRLVLLDGKGQALWTGRRPAGSILGDAGTSVSIQGLGPGRYRLRIEGLRQDSGDPGELLAEYILEVE